MKRVRGLSWGAIKAQFVQYTTGQSLLAFLPALCLGAFWLGGEIALVAVSLGIPLVMLSFFPNSMSRQHDKAFGAHGLVAKDVFHEALDDIQLKTRDNGRHSALFLLEMSDCPFLVERYGQAGAESVLARVIERVGAVLREADMVAKLGDSRFGVCLAPVQNLDLETCLELSARIQNAIEEPVALDGTSVYVSASVGFCQLSRSPNGTGVAWYAAAETALHDAKRRGPTAIRAYTNQMRKVVEARVSLREEAENALENGQIQPFFQPQISTDSGQVSGFEALARWIHPEKGMVSPTEFLPVFEEMGLLDRLGEVIIYHTLNAMKAWDASGVHVPTIGVNFSGAELNNPRLLEKVQWELDRFEIAPERLAVEILETVVSSAPGDMVARNVKGLEGIGCKIDLDDFGTGTASIAAIRRFNVARIKIDRSFVVKADRDPDQRRMLAAILTMAERLEIETLAEGVETVGEHALLAQLGCNHVQGFGIGRPMPFEKTLEWIKRHEAKLDAPPALPNRKTGDR